MSHAQGSLQTPLDVAIIGAGISGLATLKNCIQEGLSAVCFERTDHVGGLWQFSNEDYGVMRCTHINVSKENYCFSDFPFPEETPDYPHHSHMAAYINCYVDNFDLRKFITFSCEVTNLTRDESTGLWALTVQNATSKFKTTTYYRSVAIASGHHASPNVPYFEGQERFKGHIMHAVQYKDCHTNGLAGKRVVIVGIGNSAVDIANDATAHCTTPVHLSTRSGAWVLPNYLLGRPTDHYACRTFLRLPWRVASTILERVVTLLQGAPTKWGFNPKMRALQTQPTVSPTLTHHVQRGNLVIKPNIAQFEGEQGTMGGGVVSFTDGSRVECDVVVLSTGYNISVPYLDQALAAQVMDPSTNQLSLYKNVFCPAIGPSLAFIGFVQPASGGILSMAETQARWFIELHHTQQQQQQQQGGGGGRVRRSVVLPTPKVMSCDIEKERAMVSERYYGSSRHTIQRDPLVYCDMIASFFGAAPPLLCLPSLLLPFTLLRSVLQGRSPLRDLCLWWRLQLGSCGTAQWRMAGPGKWEGAEGVVRRVPVTPLMHMVGVIYAAAAAVALLLLRRLLRPFLPSLGVVLKKYMHLSR